jgi:hypothetical protein
MLSFTKSRNARKKLLQFLILFVLFLITALPQDRVDQKTFYEKMLKPGNSKLETSLLSQQSEFYEEGINAKDSRTLIYKTELGNGFLLIEKNCQYWDGSDWWSYEKHFYTYNINNNRTEWLCQRWDLIFLSG